MSTRQPFQSVINFNSSYNKSTFAKTGSASKLNQSSFLSKNNS